MHDTHHDQVGDPAFVGYCYDQTSQSWVWMRCGEDYFQVLREVSEVVAGNCGIFTAFKIVDKENRKLGRMVHTTKPEYGRVRMTKEEVAKQNEFISRMTPICDQITEVDEMEMSRES